MKILFSHPNMPGQFKHLARLYAQDKNSTVVFITKPREKVNIPGVHKVEYKLQRDANPNTHRYIIGAEKAILQAQEVWRVCKKLKAEGFVPDVVVAHPGWGDAMFVKDIFPETSLLSYCEFYYHARGVDVGFDPADPKMDDDLARVRTKNVVNNLNLEAMDWGITPTQWQWSLHPDAYCDKISILHEGIDTNLLKPDDKATISLEDGTRFKVGDEVVTYVARNFEPYRGFPSFMRAAKIILDERPNCHIIAIGADDISYGKRPAPGQNYRQMMTESIKMDYSRLHFVGTLAYEPFIRTLQVSAAHIYLTYPFVLSWSLLESMSLGCAIVGSNTPPLQEVIEHGKTGLLADFFSPEEIAKNVMTLLDSKDRSQDMRNAARQLIVERFEISDILPLYQQLIKDLAEKRFPPPTNEILLQRQGMSHEQKNKKIAFSQN